MILRIQPDDPGIERIEDRSNPFLPVLIVAVLIDAIIVAGIVAVIMWGA